MTRVRAALVGFGDETLEALASRGLLRRARKDLAKGLVSGHRDTPEACFVTVADQTVRLSEAGPAAARCDCPAAGICRHILTAVLHLQSLPLAESPARTDLSPGAGLDALDPQKYRTWATLGGLRAAMALDPPLIQFEGGTILFHFSGRQGKVVCPATAGPEDMICSVSGARGAAMRLAAILAWRSSRNLPNPIVKAKKSESKPLDTSVLKEIKGLVHDLVASGLAHISSGAPQRFQTTAISASIAQMPRLSRMLATVATRCRSELARRGDADMGALLHDLAQIEALVTGLQAGNHDLAGQHHSEYQTMESVRLFAVALWLWTTASGFHGISLLLWHEAERRWLRWTDMRPKGTPGFEPDHRHLESAPWGLGTVLGELPGQRFRLRQAKINRQGRISNSSKTLGRELAPWADDFRFESRDFARVADLEAYLHSQKVPSLSPAREDDDIVVFRPRKWCKSEFDQIEGIYRRGVKDDRGAVLTCQVPGDENHLSVIANLEDQKKLDPGTGLIGRAQLRSGMPYLEPIALIRPGNPTGARILNLTLPVPEQKGVKGLLHFIKRFITSGQEPLDRVAIAGPVQPMQDPLLRLVARLEAQLEQTAILGQCHIPESSQQELKSLAIAFENRALKTLAFQLTKFLQTPSEKTAALLRLTYLTQLTKQNITLA